MTAELIFVSIADLNFYLTLPVHNYMYRQFSLESENDTSFLLDFSRELAAVRHRDELETVVRQALEQLPGLEGYAIRLINEDRQTMRTYLQESAAINGYDALLEEVAAGVFSVQEHLHERVLHSDIPLFFSVHTELARDEHNSYLRLWKHLGFSTIAGAALRSGNTDLGILWLAIADINMALLQGICAQISTTLANIIANEALLLKDQQQAFLLAFSHDLAAVRTRSALKTAIMQVLQKLLHTRLTMIRVLEDDGVTLRPYLFDNETTYRNEALFHELVSKDISIDEPLTARVLASKEPYVFDITAEVQTGNHGPYIDFWQSVGVKYVYALPLRAGNMLIGTFWLLADEVDLTLLKGICSQVSVAIDNIRANEKVQAYKNRLEIENDYLKEQIRNIYNFSDIIGSGPAMQQVYRLMSHVAETSSTVLLLGETGTGKELIARAVHNASPRKQKLMVKVNCAALPIHLIESELFGHERGAFTGAVDRRIGKFELAHNSTLFLDEIGEMPLETQVKLLRVLQERELERIGGKSTIRVDVRIIAATNRNLEQEVAAGRFRADLFYRLNVFPIHLPPLRERPEDIEPLARFFLNRFNKQLGKHVTGIAAGVLQQLRVYSWPGNVREMEHLLERSVILSDDHLLREVHLPNRSSAAAPATTAELPTHHTMEEMERAYIIATLKRCAGRISGENGAAALLDLPSTTLHSKMKKLNITKSDYL